MLLVEQKLSIAGRDIASRLRHGCIVFEGTPAALKANEAVCNECVEV